MSKAIRMTMGEYNAIKARLNNNRVVGVSEPVKPKKLKIKYDGFYYLKILTPVLRNSKLPLPVAEHKFLPGRKYSFDMAYPERKLAIEVQGGIFKRKGGHSSIAGLMRDYEKFSEAAAIGWRILLVIPDRLTRPETVNRIKKALNYKTVMTYA